MALTTRAFRGDIVVMVNWSGTGSTYTNFCGATGGTLTVSNEIRTEQVGDCDDWSAPIQTLKKPGAQNWTMSIDGTWAAQNNRQVIDWAVDQTLLPVRVHFVNAPAGDYEYFDGSPTCLVWTSQASVTSPGTRSRARSRLSLTARPN